jgi:hypothetical protein
MLESLEAVRWIPSHTLLLCASHTEQGAAVLRIQATTIICRKKLLLHSIVVRHYVSNMEAYLLSELSIRKCRRLLRSCGADRW